MEELVQVLVLQNVQDVLQAAQAAVILVQKLAEDVLELVVQAVLHNVMDVKDLAQDLVKDVKVLVVEAVIHLAQLDVLVALELVQADVTVYVQVVLVVLHNVQRLALVVTVAAGDNALAAQVVKAVQDAVLDALDVLEVVLDGALVIALLVVQDVLDVEYLTAQDNVKDVQEDVLDTVLLVQVVKDVVLVVQEDVLHVKDAQVVLDVQAIVQEDVNITVMDVLAAQADAQDATGLVKGIVLLVLVVMAVLLVVQETVQAVLVVLEVVQAVAKPLVTVALVLVQDAQAVLELVAELVQEAVQETVHLTVQDVQAALEAVQGNALDAQEVVLQVV